MIVKHLNQLELARRWAISPRTLERWRWRKQGPMYLKIGNRIVYRLEDIERHEAERLHVTDCSTTGWRPEGDLSTSDQRA